MGLADRINAAWGALRGGYTVPLTLDDWAMQMIYAQNVYSVPSLNQTNPGQREEDITGAFQSVVSQAYARNGVVFACMLARMLLFSEARLQGIHPFCLTVDREAPAYVSHVFGEGAYATLRRPERLPEVMVNVLRRLLRG